MATQFELAQIARHNDFQARIGYQMVKEALARLSGTPDSPTILLGQRILKAQESVFQWCLGVLSDATIAAGAHQLDGSTITDTQVVGAVTAAWTPFSL